MAASNSHDPSDSQTRADAPQRELPDNRKADLAGADTPREGKATVRCEPTVAIASEADDRPPSAICSVDVTIDMVVAGNDIEHSSQEDRTVTGGLVGYRGPSQVGGNLTGLANYELLSEIARGGMGVVYRARQRNLNRIVAVKMILSGQLASDDDVQRFRSEAEAAANLQHPNIVSIHEVGEFDGQQFFSMQFVEGRSLSEVIRGTLMPPEDAVVCLRVVADAVEYAHSQGILHRDLKPSNILMDVMGLPHLTDFGVAKRLQSDSQLTATGAIIGTPSYMPPEQASGDREIGPTADVYSLGAILYEMLTRRPPFIGQRPTDVLMQVLNSEPVSPRALNPSVPMDVSTICLKCLEKSPARRYPSARALSDDLERWLRGDPIEARPIGRVERSWRWCKRNPVVASLTALLVLVMFGAFVGITAEWLVAQSALHRMQEAQVQRAAAQVEGLLKAAPESLTPILNNLKLQYDEIVPELRRSMTRQDLSDRDRLRLSVALLPGDPLQVNYLRDRMLSIAMAELLAVRKALVPYREQLRQELLDVLSNTQAVPDSRFSAALILAEYEAGAMQHDPGWQAHAPFLTARMLESISTDPSLYEPLVDALGTVRQAILPSLTKTFGDRSEPQSMRALATNILVRYQADQPVELARLLVAGEPWQFLVIRPRLTKSMSTATDVLVAQLSDLPLAQASDAEKELSARRRATAGIALLQLGAGEPVWPLLIQSDDPRLRSHLIELCCLLKTDPSLLVDRLYVESNVSARRAILLSLGSYDLATIPEQVREPLLAHCAEIHLSDPDAGIHSASEWLLRQSDRSKGVTAAEAPRAGLPPQASDWITGPEGHTFAVIDAHASAAVGSPSKEEGRSVAESSHQMVIGRKFALATKEVTIEQFRRFTKLTGLNMPPFTHKHSPDNTGPMIMVTWYRAAQYCRWLSEQAGVPEDQMCYPPIEAIKEGMQPIADYLDRTGFRLPTEAEWEFACRAGASTSRSFGSSEELLPRYASYLSSASDRAWPAGRRKPNDFGLFDMHGNVWEWCGDRWTNYWENPRGRDNADLSVVDAASNRVLRGGSFDSAAKAVRSAFRDRFEKPHFRSDEVGFRVSRTVPE